MVNDDYDLDYLLYGGLPPGPLDKDEEDNDQYPIFTNAVSCSRCRHSEIDNNGIWCNIFNEYVDSREAYDCEYY